jgi:ribosomal protein S27AE
MGLQEPMACPLCSDSENMRFMDRAVKADEGQKWVCSRCGLVSFEDPKKGARSQYDGGDTEGESFPF